MKTVVREQLDGAHAVAVFAQRSSDADLETLAVLMCGESVIAPNTSDSAAEAVWGILGLYRIQYGSAMRVVVMTEQRYNEYMPLPDVIEDYSGDDLLAFPDEFEIDEDEDDSWNWFFSAESPSGGVEEFGPYDSKREAYEGWERVRECSFHSLDGPYKGSKE